MARADNVGNIEAMRVAVDPSFVREVAAVEKVGRFDRGEVSYDRIEGLKQQSYSGYEKAAIQADYSLLEDERMSAHLSEVASDFERELTDEDRQRFLEELAGVRDALPDRYVPLNDRELEFLGRVFECDGHLHPVAMIGVKGTAVRIESGLVEPTPMSLEQVIADPAWAPNLVYFSRIYAFHPGTLPEPGGSIHKPQPLSQVGTPRPVLTIDTGALDVHSKVSATTFEDLGGADNWPVDGVRGHGPAIADLIGERTGRPDWSYLFGVSRTSPTGLGHGYLVEVLEDNGTPHWVRGFDTQLLLEALDIGLKTAPQGDLIVNLSLGTIALPSDMVNAKGAIIDPIGRRLTQWLSSNTGSEVVVAAGNHDTCVPGWPAAYAHNWSGKHAGPNTPVQDRIHSIGSGKQTSFSAHGDWVTAIEPGDKIQVDTQWYTSTSWTGTSFAAPQAAAKRSLGHQLTK